jgi:hypothetical protein
MPIFARLLAARRTLFVLAAVLFVSQYVSRPAVMHGDIWDYLYPCQAFFDHSTPDIRNQDIARVDPILKANGRGDLGPYSVDNLPPFSGIFKTPRGHCYAYHFWLYPLFTQPAKLLLWCWGRNELSAFQVTNAFLFVCALYLALFHCRAPLSKRLTLAGLSAVSPVVWYLSWPSPEVFTWSFVLISLVFLTNEQYILASASAALAAMQNPPVLFLALYIVLLSGRHRRPGLVLATAAGAALALVPNLFYYHHFGVANPIVAWGGTDHRLISLQRTWSFLTDLNQGMLPYVPLVVLLSGVALYRSLRYLSWTDLGTFGVLGVMILAAETTTNWNSGASGMMRYAVWALPIFAWWIAECGLPARALARWAGVGVAIQAVIVLGPGSQQSYVHQTPLARLILSHAPALYDPEPEIFIERQMHNELVSASDCLPLPFVTNDWRVTKVLVDRNSLRQLPKKFIVDPKYLETVEEAYHDRPGLFYLNPPRGKVKLEPGPGPERFKAALRVALENVPCSLSSPQFQVGLRVENVSDLTFWPLASGRYTPLRLVYQQLSEAGLYQTGGYWDLLDTLLPGQTQTVPVVVTLPQRTGEYTLEVRPLLDNVAWGDVQVRLHVSVRAAGSYLAVVKPD